MDYHPEDQEAPMSSQHAVYATSNVILGIQDHDAFDELTIWFYEGPDDMRITLNIAIESPPGPPLAIKNEMIPLSQRDLQFPRTYPWPEKGFSVYIKSQCTWSKV